MLPSRSLSVVTGPQYDETTWRGGYAADQARRSAVRHLLAPNEYILWTSIAHRLSGRGKHLTVDDLRPSHLLVTNRRLIQIPENGEPLDFEFAFISDCTTAKGNRGGVEMTVTLNTGEALRFSPYAPFQHFTKHYLRRFHRYGGTRPGLLERLLMYRSRPGRRAAFWLRRRPRNQPPQSRRSSTLIARISSADRRDRSSNANAANTVPIRRKIESTPDEVV